MGDPNAPKRPLTGYMRYIGTIRDEVQKETGLNGIKVTPHLSARWNALTDEEKAPFNAEFKVEMAEHKKKWKHTEKQKLMLNFLQRKKQKNLKRSQKIKMLRRNHKLLILSCAMKNEMKLKPL